MFFPGDVIIIPLVISIPLFFWQFRLSCKNYDDHRDLIPLAVPGVTLLLGLWIYAFGGGGGGFLDLSGALAAIIALMGLWFLVVDAFAWLTAHMIKKFRK